MKLKDCKNELDYAEDCPIKRALKTITKHPLDYHVNKWEVSDPTIEAEYGKTMYTKVTVEIELFAELYFDEKKKLRRAR